MMNKLKKPFWSRFSRSSSTKLGQQGFTMAEMIIALSILSFGIVLVYGAFSSAVIVTNNIQSRFAAAYLAQEGLEIVRNLRDNNFIAKAQDSSVTWMDGLSGGPCDVGCMVDYTTQTTAQLIPWDESFLRINDQGFYSYAEAGTPTIFKRKIIITPLLGLENNAMNVSVTVYWDYNGKSFSFEANENLYNWY
jgi:prepilin-type N-terminal cleavage/methylation domain-containing protein